MAFFVLSGFLITLRLLRQSARDETISLTDFYRRRAFRILPAFYGFVFFELILDLFLHKGRPWTDYVSVVLFAGNIASVLYYPGPITLAHTWSLAVEEHFYLLWPAVFFYLRRTPARLAKLLILVIIVISIVRTPLVLSGAISVWAAYVLTWFRFDHLALGCLLALALIYFPRTIRWIWSRPWLPWMTALFLLVELAICSRGGFVYERSIGFLLDPILIGLFMMQAIAFSWKWICSLPLRYLGKLSYAIYLFHWLGVELSGAYLAHASSYERGLFIIAFGVGMGALAHHLIERPFLAWSRMASRKPADREPSLATA